MKRDYLSQARQDKRGEQRRADVQQLKDFGWVEIYSGQWMNPKNKHSYPTREAIDICMLRSEIKRNGRNAGFAKADRRKK